MDISTTGSTIWQMIRRTEPQQVAVGIHACATRNWCSGSLALYADLPGYKPPVTQFLNEYMRTNRNKPSQTVKLLAAFTATMQAIKDVFGGKAFRTLRDGKESSNLNRARY